MSKIPGSVAVTGVIAPTDSTDTFAVTEDIYGRGGWRSVANVSARNAITADRRKEGMVVFCIAEDVTYILKGGVDNANWEEYAGGAGGNGKSAYEIAVDHGFLGNEQQWLDSLAAVQPTFVAGVATAVDSDKQPTITLVKNGTTHEYTINAEIPRGQAGEHAVAALQFRGDFNQHEDPPYTVSEFIIYPEVLSDGSTLGKMYVCKKDNPTNTAPTTGAEDDEFWSLFALQGSTGRDGEKGEKGDTGDTPNLTFAVKTGNPGTVVEINQTGDPENVHIELTIPRGDVGETGQDGADGVDGRAATISVDPDVEVLDPYDPPTVTNTGTATDAVLRFGFPEGWGGASAGGGKKYKDTTGALVAVGGIPVGFKTEEAGMEVADVVYQMLHPFLAPSFSSFSLSGVSTRINVGDTLAAGRTATFAISNANNAKLSSIVIKQGSTVIAQGFGGTSPVVTTSTEVKKTVAGSETFTISGDNIQDKAMTSKTFTVTWAFPVIYGEGPATLDDAGVNALRVKDISNGSTARDYVFQAGQYKWICVPSTNPQIGSAVNKANQLDVPLNPPVEINVTNVNGIKTSYRCWRTVNELGGSLTITVK